MEPVLYQALTLMHTACDQLRPRLQAIDPRLNIWYAVQDDPENEIRAGWFYASRFNEDGTTCLWEVRDPEFAGQQPDDVWEQERPYEPGEELVEAFRRWDANTAGSSPADRDARREALRRRKEKREQDQLEENADRVWDEFQYHTRTHAPIGDPRPWEKAT